MLAMVIFRDGGCGAMRVQYTSAGRCFVFRPDAKHRPLLVWVRKIDQWTWEER